MTGPVANTHRARLARMVVIVVAAFTCFHNPLSMQHLAGRGTPRGTICD